MNYDKYAERLITKIERTIELYGRHIFLPISKVNHVLAYRTKDHLRMPPENKVMKEIYVPEVWGGEYENVWLKAIITVPENADKKILCAIPDVDAVEILCWKNGRPNGIINSKNKFVGGNHCVMFVDAEAKAGQQIEIAFECYAGHKRLGTQPGDNLDADETGVREEDFYHTYNGITLYIMDTIIRDCVFDLATVVQLAQLDASNYTSLQAYQCLKKAFPYIIQDQKLSTDKEIHDSAVKIIECLSPVLIKGHPDTSRGKIYVTGHSHMDTAWLWPMSETIRKCARTYSEVLTLMDMYPEYSFIQSSALHLDWMRVFYPAIFEGICKRINEGRYEPNGGVWVECDCNITGGEALARQFLYGQRFTQRYLNYRSDCFWLPDTFGYNAAIPQIMRESGVKYFYTTKLSWNDLNPFPAGTFIWRGIDGSEVLCHLNATHSMPDPKTITENYACVNDRYSEPMRFAAYGFGDGGGGPTYGMLEYLKRAKDLVGLPQIEKSTASEFMQKVETIRDTLPICDGELYLELHRGTLTKMHDVKKNNRLAEISLHDFELLNVLCGLETHPKHDEYWKILLKNQFHDILPGTCIPKVYEVEIPEMAELIASVRKETTAYAEKLTEKQKDTISLLNTLSFRRNDVAIVDGEMAFTNHASQTYYDLEGNCKTAVAVSAEPMQSVVLQIGKKANESTPFHISDNHINTPYYDIELDTDGYICYMLDRLAKRRVDNPKGRGLGVFFYGEEMPSKWDNWDVDDDCLEKLMPVQCISNCCKISIGEVEIRIRNSYKIGRESRIDCDTILYSTMRRIDYEVKVDWKERHGMLKAGFDVNVRTVTVKNEIQFGNIDRPTTRNNSIETAKFEVSNIKWSDMSETRYGVALLNDCKYGMNALGTCMYLTLQLGGTRPDPITEFGVHTMKYSLLPHEGAFSAENTVQPAYELNYPYIQVAGRMMVPQLFSIDASNIMCEAVKNAEDVENAYVLRLYECERNHTNANLNVKNAKYVWETNMLEEKKEELIIDKDGNVQLCFHPFEIKTLLIAR